MIRAPRYAVATEEAVDAVLGIRRLGGLGEPDCEGQGMVVEVSDQARRYSKHQLDKLLRMRWAQKGELIVGSRSGFSEGAQGLASKYDDLYLYKLGPSSVQRSSLRVYPTVTGP